MVRTQRFHCCGLGSVPGRGTEIKKKICQILLAPSLYCLFIALLIKSKGLTVVYRALLYQAFVLFSDFFFIPAPFLHSQYCSHPSFLSVFQNH